MLLHVYDTPAEVTNALAVFFISTGNEAIEKNGRFNVSLSGGSSPKALYELLASDDFKTRIDWTRVYFFFGDERYVPAKDERYNGHMVQKALFEPLQIKDAQIFLFDTTLEPAACAADYEKKIVAHFGTANPVFDLNLLGLGDNSHTASLFPHTTVLYEEEALVKEVWVEEVHMYRVTMTAKLINLSRHIVFFLYGQGKAAAVHNIIQRERNIEEYPAQLIRPVQGDLHWFIDRAAASNLA